MVKLIQLSQFLNDSTLKNVHWARCTGVFRTRDIGRIEREFLEVLAFDLNITEADVLSHHAPVMALLHPIPHIARSSSLFERVAKHLTWSAGESTLGDSPNPSSASSSSVETSASPNTPEDPRTSLAESQNPQSTISAEATEELPLQLTPPPAYSHHDPNSQSATKTTSQKSHHHHHHHQHNHHRFSTALQMLRSIPISIPNFHTSPVSTSPSSSSSSSSSSSLSDAESESSVSPHPPSVSIPASRKSASYRSASPHAADHSSSSVRVSILPSSNERCRPALFQRVSSHLIVGQV